MNPRQYETARTAAVVADRSDRSFVRVYGRDPVKMIQGLVTNDIAGAPADRAVYAAVLTPKGKMVADVRVVRHGDDLLLETDSAAADPLMTHLRKFVPPLFARFEDANDAWRELGVYGPRAADTLSRVFGGSVPPDAAEDDIVRTTFADEPAMIVATSSFDVPGCDVFVPASSAERVRASLLDAGAVAIDAATLDVLRIEKGTPRWGAELVETTIPLEAGLRERAISETKGCYTGQEVIVRILHRGHVNWLLRGVLLGGADVPAAETPLLNRDGKRVGRITSAARSPRLAQAIALAYVRREIEPGAALHLGEAAGPVVSVVALPFGREAPAAADV